ncbi:amidohydrolase [Brachybacterium sp. ACRRE]|uniref:amidohydrolase n=1 Tax=Brachybacterium sp. ACRRE TaxID=2918184 RepID=UPI001EF33FDF|nr:amidohydrolase family protein [Brachybacterium sp. ACRRE]MCG7310754.1 amidohydrolase family protein [Brachybacterium sp. ACRRE]
MATHSATLREPLPGTLPGTLLREVRRVGADAAPVDLRIAQGVIEEIAPAGGLAARADDEVVAAGGAWVGPGLWDHHTHMDQWSLARRRIDVSACTSAAELARTMADAAGSRDRDRDPVLIGHGFRDGVWPDRAERALLDAAVPGRPAVAISHDLHTVWANGAALDLLARGLGRSLPEDGVLREADAFDATGQLSRVPEGTLDGWVREAVRDAAWRGVVGVVDLEMGFGIETWRRRMAAGADALRVRSGIYPRDLERALRSGLRTGQAIEGTAGLLAVGPFKLVLDGSLGTRTAWVEDAYDAHADGTDGTDGTDHGLRALPPEEALALTRRAHAGGLVPALHAIGDRAVALALDIFEETGAHGSIEHAQLVSEKDLPRFAELGVEASIQPEHAMDDRDVADRHWSGRTGRAFAFGSLVQAGARLRLGSDAPVAPLDPWISMAAAVARERDGREAWHPEQRISREIAWSASTDGRRTIGVGDTADLVLTAEDPLAMPPSALRDMEVLGTIRGGAWTHRAL